MNYFILTIVLIAGIFLGRYFVGRQKVNFILEQVKRKRKNKEKILKFSKENKKMTNNNVETMLDVSDSTAERYLDELEKENKIKQVGTTGRNVFYTLK